MAALPLGITEYVEAVTLLPGWLLEWTSMNDPHRALLRGMMTFAQICKLKFEICCIWIMMQKRLMWIFLQAHMWRAKLLLKKKRLFYVTFPRTVNRNVLRRRWRYCDSRSRIAHRNLVLGCKVQLRLIRVTLKWQVKGLHRVTWAGFDRLLLNVDENDGTKTIIRLKQSVKAWLEGVRISARATRSAGLIK
jgi:hypothetical protein